MKRLTDMLAKVAELQSERRFIEAREMLDALVVDPNVGELGEQTSLHYPRRLHAALLRLAKAEGNELSRIGYQFHLVPPPDRLAAFAFFSLDERRAIAMANRAEVPRVIHQIWIGTLPVPPATQAWADHARAQGYDYRLWREADLQAAGISDEPLFRAMLTRGDYPGAVDVARYLILWREGGVYLDCDWYPTRKHLSFHDLLSMRGMTALAEEIPRNTGKGGLLLANSFIATPAGHPVMQRLNEILAPIRVLMPRAPAWWATGPLIFTLVARGGPITLADADFVAGQLPQGAPLDAAQAFCATASQEGIGLLLAWKSW